MTPVTTPTAPSETALYFRVGIFSLLLFGSCYAYTSFLKIPGTLNKSVADTAIILVGLSMLLSSLCYFWNFFDSVIRYRKHLGLVGFAYAIAHLVLSLSAFQALLKVETWEKGLMWPALTGVIAMVIFAIMAIISNSMMAQLLGGKVWRAILRTGYIAIIFVCVHVVLLKFPRWLTWYTSGMQTLPSLSLIVTLFMLIVLIMRVILWWSLKQPNARTKR